MKHDTQPIRHPGRHARRACLLALLVTLGLSVGVTGHGFAQDTSAPSQPGAPQDAPGQQDGRPDTAPDDEDTRPTITLERKTKEGEIRTIRIVKTGPDEAGVAFICTPPDDAPGDAPTRVVYYDTSQGGVQMTVDKNVIVAPLAVIVQKNGENGDKGDGHVEMTAGTAADLPEIPEGAQDPLVQCGVNLKPEVKPDTVNVTQGKTRLRGSKLVYDESDGVARISGPITFTRDDLNGKSERIDVDVDKQTTTLIGNVELVDGNRVSKAERVDYDDTKNVAILYGTDERPAESVTPRESIKAKIIRYNLDTKEVVVSTNITGKFEDGEDGSPAGDANPTAPAPADPPSQP